MDEFFTKCNSVTNSVTFTISGTGATITNRGVVTKNSKNNGNNDLEYTVTMTYTDPYDNNRQKSIQGTVKQPKDANPVYNVTFTYPQIGYDGGTSTPTITVKKNGSTITNYNLNITGITITSVKEGSTNVSTTGFSGNKDTKGITAPANVRNAKTIYATITGTIDGVTFTSNSTITQNTVNKYIWFGYSETTPTEFGNWTHGEQKEASKVYSGAEQAKVQTVNTQHARCHWIIIPKDSAYKLSEVRDTLNKDIKALGIGEEILPTASNAIKDGKNRAYYMWHKTTNAYIQAPTTFILSLK